MRWFVNSLLTGITAFVATNIDDIVILTVFFTQIHATFRTRHIVIGQYLGFFVLVLASLPGFLGGLIIPKFWIGLLGLLPILVGIRFLLQLNDRDDEVQSVTEMTNTPSSGSWIRGWLAPPIYQVAAVTVANGGDNVGIYVPLFASCSPAELGIILCVFFILISVWCGIAYYLSRHPRLAPVLARYGKAIVPFVLIGLGILILVENMAPHQAIS